MNYRSIIKEKNRIRLQGIGWVDAVPMSEVIPGMKIMLNFGYEYKVLDKIIKNGMIVLKMSKWSMDGCEWNLRRRPSTLVAAF